jgi:hypothetical protein
MSNTVATSFAVVFFEASGQARRVVAAVLVEDRTMKHKLGKPVKLYSSLRNNLDSDLTFANPIASTINSMLVKLWCTIGERLKSAIWSEVYDRMEADEV